MDLIFQVQTNGFDVNLSVRKKEDPFGSRGAFHLMSASLEGQKWRKTESYSINYQLNQRITCRRRTFCRTRPDSPVWSSLVWRVDILWGVIFISIHDNLEKSPEFVMPVPDQVRDDGSGIQKVLNSLNSGLRRYEVWYELQTFCETIIHHSVKYCKFM